MGIFFYIPIKGDYLYKNDLVLVAEWYGNECPNDEEIEQAIKDSRFVGAHF